MNKNIKYYLKVVFVAIVILGLIGSYIFSPNNPTTSFQGPTSEASANGPTTPPGVTGPTEGAPVLQ